MEKKQDKTSKAVHQLFVSRYCNIVTEIVTEVFAKKGFTVAEALSLPIQIICKMICDNYDREESDEIKETVFKSISAGLDEMYANVLQYEIR